MTESPTPANGRAKKASAARPAAEANAKKPAKKAAPNLDWHAVKTTGGYTFVQKLNARGGLSERFAFFMDGDGEAERLAALLRKLDPAPKAKKAAPARAPKSEA